MTEPGERCVAGITDGGQLRRQRRTLTQQQREERSLPIFIVLELVVRVRRVLVVAAPAAEHLATTARASLDVAPEMVEPAGLDTAVAAPSTTGRPASLPAPRDQRNRYASEMHRLDRARPGGRHLLRAPRAHRHQKATCASA
jgi:hypothetical protein